MSRRFSVLRKPNGGCVAYRALFNEVSRSGDIRTETIRPFVMFVPGFNSSMWGRKAEFLEDWATSEERKGLISGFGRFDYSTVGALAMHSDDHHSCVSEWLVDTRLVIETVYRRLNSAHCPLLLVGSSMGFWISSLIAKNPVVQNKPISIAGIIGVGSAPDFTEMILSKLDIGEKEKLYDDGYIVLPSEYSRDGYKYTLKLFKDGKNHLILNSPLEYKFPVRLLHGSLDRDVPVSCALELAQHTACDNLHLTIVKGSDHRFSGEENLKLLAKAIADIIGIKSF